MTAMSNTTRRPSRAFGAVALLATLFLAAGCASEPATPRTPAAPSSPAQPVRKLRMPDTLLGLPKSMSRVATGAAKQHLDTLKRDVAPVTSAVGWAYGNDDPDADMVYITGVSGTVTDGPGLIDRSLQPYRIESPKPVEPGELGGTARCGQGRSGDGSHLVVCAWADDQTLGIVAFVSSRPQGDRTAQFHEVRSAMTETAA
ncbi:hypothetical protein [Micromonospora sp. NPDC049240]|uniref:hypothetical protein n=1 Tax=Micromonospora sp. NPDC049240 TaxID=3155151 RepID=UPI003402D001